jgi:hypothetical protein
MSNKTQQTETKTSAPPLLHMPNPASIAENVVRNATEFCARKMGVEGRAAAVARMQENDLCAREYCYYSIAEQVGSALGAMDQHVKAVYVFECEATADDLCFGDAVYTPLLHLLVWAERRTEALNALVATLDRALAQQFAATVGPQGLRHLLDVQIIDDVEVQERSGYGALLHSLHHRPIKVWQH